jgi:hypothetical protein
VTAATQRPQRSALSIVLVEANGLDHGPACGERIACPCGVDRGPYRLAERQVRRGGTFVICHGCGKRWREVAA